MNNTTEVTMSFDYADMIGELAAEFNDEAKNNLEWAGEHFAGIVEILFGGGEINLMELYHHLEEVGASVNVPIPERQPNIERPENIFKVACDIVRRHATIGEK